MLTITEKAADKIKSFFESEADAKGKCLRLKLVPAGCAGFKYEFAFDLKKSEDEILPQQGFDVVVDKNSLPYLESATVDYREDAMGAGFKINNPKEKSSCGCGESKQF